MNVNLVITVTYNAHTHPTTPPLTLHTARVPKSIPLHRDTVPTPAHDIVDHTSVDPTLRRDEKLAFFRQNWQAQLSVRVPPSPMSYEEGSARDAVASCRRVAPSCGADVLIASAIAECNCDAPMGGGSVV